MQISLKTALIGAGLLLLAFFGVAVYATSVRRGYEAQIVELQNQVASRDQTIETQKGVYERLAIQSQDLTQLLGTKDKELVLLKDQLKKQGADLLTANTLVVQLQKKIADGNATVVITPPTETAPGQFKVWRTEQLGPFDVYCEMSGEQPVREDHVNSHIELSQPRPVSFSVVVSQDKNGVWRSAATSSDPDFKVDISLAAVNPYMLEPKWYEKISLSTEVGIGTNPGFLAGLGASYQIGKFELGPKVWVVIDRGVSPYFGASLLWHPFQK